MDSLTKFFCELIYAKDKTPVDVHRNGIITRYMLIKRNTGISLCNADMSRSQYTLNELISDFMKGYIGVRFNTDIALIDKSIRTELIRYLKHKHSNNLDIDSILSALLKDENVWKSFNERVSLDLLGSRC